MTHGGRVASHRPAPECGTTPATTRTPTLIHSSPAKAHSALDLLGHHGRCLTVELFAGIRIEADEQLPHFNQTDKLGHFDQGQERRRLLAPFDQT